MNAVRLGHLFADQIYFQDAVTALIKAAQEERGGYVVTPNVDHVVLAEQDQSLRDAYNDAGFSLVDGRPLMWIAQGMKTPLPERITGADLLGPLTEAAAKQQMRLFLLGAAPGVAAQAGAMLEARYPGIQIAGVSCPPMGFEHDPSENQRILDQIRAAKPHFIYVALGCPKQERWMYKYKDAYAPAIALGIGAGLDFIAGTLKRAPKWMARVGLEWFYRLSSEPRRLAHRYLIRDPQIFRIGARMMRVPHRERTFQRHTFADPLASNDADWTRRESQKG